ncbi:MAG: hypothetical protein ACK4PR_07050 [Gammaproteobacteria bacterium]
MFDTMTAAIYRLFGYQATKNRFQSQFGKTIGPKHDAESKLKKAEKRLDTAKLEINYYKLRRAGEEETNTWFATKLATIGIDAFTKTAKTKAAQEIILAFEQDREIDSTVNVLTIKTGELADLYNELVNAAEEYNTALSTYNELVRSSTSRINK